MTKNELLVRQKHKEKKVIFDSISIRYLTLTKIGRSTSALQFYSCSIASVLHHYLLPVCSLLFIHYYSSSCQLS
jgi:hypothetical protein